MKIYPIIEQQISDQDVICSLKLKDSSTKLFIRKVGSSSLPPALARMFVTKVYLFLQKNGEI